MAEVGISYAHRDAPDALRLHQVVRAGGLTAWMDDPADEAEDGPVGIPVGGAHWDVIEREFADAEVIVVLDTPAWHASEYCQREYRRCRQLGKWIVFATPDRAEAAVADIESGLSEHGELLAAHARVAARAVSTDNDLSWFQRALFRRSAADAELLLSRVGDESPVTLTPAIREVLKTDLDASRATRRTLRRVGVAVVASLAVLATGAGVAWVVAERLLSLIHI